MKDELLISKSFRSKIETLHGDLGKAWLDRLPGLISQYAAKWDLTIERPISHLSYNFVCQATQKHQEVIVKAGVSNQGIASEIAALARFAGQGCVRLLHADSEDGIMVMEKIEPGNTLDRLFTEGRDEEAMLIVCKLIETLHAKSHNLVLPDDAESLTDWAQGFEKLRHRFHGTSGPFNADLYERAEKEYHQLIATQSKPHLLHGDLHHFNILQGPINGTTPSWTAIDPQGVIGEALFEIAAFMRNPVPGVRHHVNLKALLNRRIDLTAEYFNSPKKRVWAWAFSQTILASTWLYQDLGKGWELWAELGQVLLDNEPQGQIT